MKKLKLTLSNMEGAEILTREQLKKIVGGDGSGTISDPVRRIPLGPHRIRHHRLGALDQGHHLREGGLVERRDRVHVRVRDHHQVPVVVRVQVHDHERAAATVQDVGAVIVRARRQRAEDALGRVGRRPLRALDVRHAPRRPHDVGARGGPVGPAHSQRLWWNQTNSAPATTTISPRGASSDSAPFSLKGSTSTFMP